MSKPLVSGEEERGRGSPVLSEGGSSDEEQGMVLVPLLSPPSSGELKQSSSRETPSPLFLTVRCALRDASGEHREDVTLTDCFSTCLSESPPLIHPSLSVKATVEHLTKGPAA